jgi:hypothetical protein
LGSAYARIHTKSRTLLFGGDLGRYGRPVLPDPLPIDHADVLLVESTYGNRVHEPDDNGERLEAIVNRAVTRGGKLIIPAFAIGRVEEVIYWLRRLEEEKRIPILPVYIDSPMAASALEFYKQRMRELDPDLNRNVRDVCAFCTARMTVVETADQSRAVTASREPAIVIAASDGRPRPAPPGCGLAGREEYRPLCRLPGRRYARPRALRRHPPGQDAGPAGARDGDRRAAGLDVRARRRQRNHAMALGLFEGAGDDIPGARGAGGGDCAGGSNSS